jgi:ankyrin repeat protein
MSSFVALRVPNTYGLLREVILIDDLVTTILSFFSLDNEAPPHIRGSEGLAEMCYKLKNPELLFKTLAFNNYASLFEALLLRRADADTALLAACRSGLVNLAEMALHYGANSNVGLSELCSSNVSLLFRGALLSPRQSAASFSQLQFQLIDLMLHNGADPNIGLMNLCSSFGNSDLVSLMLSRGANPDFGLIEACSINSGVIQLLLSQGADPNVGLFVASRHGNSTIVNMMLSRKADTIPSPGEANIIKNYRALGALGALSLEALLIPTKTRVDVELELSRVRGIIAASKLVKSQGADIRSWIKTSSDKSWTELGELDDSVSASKLVWPESLSPLE